MVQKKSDCTCRQDRRLTANMASLQKYRLWFNIGATPLLIVLITTGVLGLHDLTTWFLLVVTIGWQIATAVLVTYRLTRGHDFGCAMRWALAKAF